MKERKNERKKDFLFYYYNPPPLPPPSDKEEKYSIFLFFNMPLQNKLQQQLNIYYSV
jgi:hypothetical protein